MRLGIVIISSCVISAGVLIADKPVRTQEDHKEASAKIAEEQDELSADVQQLIIEQTIPQVIEFFNDAEKIMDEATDQLDDGNTGGETIAAQTEVIEKIHDAAKEKQKQGGGKSQSSGAMLDMMEKMMESDKPGDKEGKGKGQSKEGAQGQSGESETANDANGGTASGKDEQRRVPKAGGNRSLELPEEFRKAFDAYNRGAEKIQK